MKRDLIEMIFAVAVTELSLLITMAALFTVESIKLKIAVIVFTIAFGTVSYAALIAGREE